MATWTFEEDFLVCVYYLDHIDDWKEHLDELLAQLKEAGYNRDKGSIKMRIGNFQHLETAGTRGLKNAAKQSQRIHQAFSKHRSNKALTAHIQNTYTGVAVNSSIADFDEDQILDPDYSCLTASQQTIYKMVFNLPQAPSFKDVLFGFINDKGFKKHSDVYNACYVKRDTFNTIKHGKNYGVSRRTVMQLCFGLKLNYDEAVILMASAGYAFSPNNLTDVIVKYYLVNGIYDIFEVNISLYDSGADLLF